MSARKVTYLDSSAIVKLVVHEPESPALSRYLRGRSGIASSALARVEVLRVALALGPDRVARATEVLRRIELVRMSDRVLDLAASLLPPELRSLDAVHLATAGLFADTLGKVVTYDDRMARAATALGWSVLAPA